MSYQLRPYQTELLDRVSQSWNAGNRSVMLQLPTGGGKTILFSHLVAQTIERGGLVLILAHREELITQSADKVHTITGITPGIIKAGYKPDYDRVIQVASVQALTRRLSKCPHFDLIVVDEAHHSTANSYRSILTHFLNSLILGVTATPIRLDGSGFRGLFDDLICGVTLGERSKLDEWEDRFKRLVNTNRLNGHKPAWIGYRLAEMNPPLEVWRMAEKYLGYKRGWAVHRWRECQEVAA